MANLPEDLENLKGQPAALVELTTRREALSRPEGYKPDAKLVDAIKVALLLRKPLLVTGRPGTGKTELGHYLAWKMGLSAGEGVHRYAYQFDSKSNSIARDLFYTYDAIGHYRAGGEIRPFLSFNALGRALLRCARPTDELKELLPEFDTSKPGHVARQSVVVIDEIDKAPRDFPNDLLNEIDRSYFHIQELKNLKVEADRVKAPILVITSNSEKNLPAAFLRRCVYYDIEPHSEKELREIVSIRLTEFADANGALLKSAVEKFGLLAREDSGMKHKPGTAELLDWLAALLGRGAQLDVELNKQGELMKATYAALVKSQEDRAVAKKILEETE